MKAVGVKIKEKRHHHYYYYPEYGILWNKYIYKENFYLNNDSIKKSPTMYIIMNLSHCHKIL